MDYEYFPKHCRLITMDFNNQTELGNPDLKQKINFIGRLKRNKAAAMFFVIEKRRNHFSFFTNFCKCYYICIKMETQKIVILLNDSDNESSKFGTRK